MEATKLTDLPLLYQLIAGAGLFFGTACIAFMGWLWPKLKNKLPEAFQPPMKANEAVVLSAAIADSAKISELAHSIDRLVIFLKEDAEDDARRVDRLDENVRDVVTELRSIKSAIRERTIV